MDDDWFAQEWWHCGNDIITPLFANHPHPGRGSRGRNARRLAFGCWLPAAAQTAATSQSLDGAAQFTPSRHRMIVARFILFCSVALLRCLDGLLRRCCHHPFCVKSFQAVHEDTCSK